MKNKTYIGILFICGVLLSVLAFSCTLGLGAAVDLDAPEVAITSHRDNDSIPETFVIRGTATDNVGVEGITVSLVDAGIYYKMTYGGQWYKKTSVSDWTIVPVDAQNYCTGEAASLRWSVAVDTNDRISQKTDKSYTVTVTATDKMQNSGRKSKAECTVKLDTESPNVSVYKPELNTKTYAEIAAEAANYTLKDGNYLSRLLNGTLVLYGRQSGALSSKELLIEFDNGKLEAGKQKTTINSSTPVTSVEEIKALPDAQFEDDGTPTVYFSKKLTGEQLSEWTLTVTPDEWATNASGVANGLNSGLHIIRVVTTSISGSNGWERKILGYFVWWPEADTPWITASSGDEEQKDTEIYELYQNANISGNAYDDDGIKSIVSVISEYDELTGEYIPGTPENHQLPYSGDGSASTYAAWSAKVPAKNGRFRIDATVTDLYGTYDTVTRYFKTADVSAPRIEITSPTDNDFAMADVEGNITFTGTASDDVGITELAVVWLNPKKSSDPNNKIAYMTGAAEKWSTATTGGYTDAAGNKVFLLYRGVNGEKQPECTINKTFNVFSDLGIGRNDTFLTTQDFIFRVSDGQSATLKSVTLAGDTSTPSLAFNTITINGNTQSLADGNIPTYPAMSNVQAMVTGTWSDTFSSTLANIAKVYAIELSWGNGAAKTTASVVPNANGTWSTIIDAPPSGGTLTATIKDYGGNSKTVQSAASIETAAWRLDHIDCLDDDGAYKAGDILRITLEFTKNTTVTGTPSLTLNNGGSATYVSGDGTASHVFEYKVGSGETSKLTVDAIVANGAKWGDSALNGRETVSTLEVPKSANLATTRTIKIDNTAPRVTSVMLLSADGYYGARASLLFKVEFSEDVTITNGSYMKIAFGNGLETSSTTVSGSRLALCTYVVAPGDNASPLTFSEITGGSAEVTDAAGNELISWTPMTRPDFSGMYVDTSAPAAPTYENDWNPGALIIDDAGTSFTLDVVSIEPGATVEYSLDGDSNWVPYSGTVSLTNNGTYQVTARQTDKAGNVSDYAVKKIFTIDKGELLTRITASTVNGTYSTQTTTKDIVGKIEFRRKVTIAKDAYVTLNVEDSAGNYKTCPINECVEEAASGTVFTFTYTIAEGDAVAGDGKIDVTGWNMTVSVGDRPVPVPLPKSGTGKRFAENRSIKIQTVAPKITKCELNAAGNLEITFDRAVSKGTGSISFAYNHTKEGNGFRVPVVLTEQEYNEMMLVPAAKSAVENAYTAGMNGALFTSNGFEFDTATKYVLDYDKANTDETLVAAFKTAKKDQLTIPLIASEVSFNATNTVLTVLLSGAYKLPVKGAEYNLSIPAEAFTDSVKNVTAMYTGSITAPGVEPPQFRLKTTAATITNAGNTKNASTDMSKAQTAKVKIDCRTPGATIYYGMKTESLSSVTINSCPSIVSTTERFIEEAASEGTEYTEVITLGGDTGQGTDTYDAATGLRFGISAVAKTENATSDVSYEYAARTVLKLDISGNYGNQAADKPDNYNTSTAVTENRRTLTMKDLKVWVMGGDSSSGPNSFASTPLSWMESSKFKLMAGSHGSGNNMYGQWYWVTWEIASPTYIGFVVGDVPSDAADRGPTTWYAATYHWVSIKSQYKLFPGDTLIMSVDSNSSSLYGQKFLFDTGLKGSR